MSSLTLSGKVKRCLGDGPPCAAVNKDGSDAAVRNGTRGDWCPRCVVSHFIWTYVNQRVYLSHVSMSLLCSIVMRVSVYNLLCFSPQIGNKRNSEKRQTERVGFCCSSRRIQLLQECNTLVSLPDPEHRHLFVVWFNYCPFASFFFPPLVFLL